MWESPVDDNDGVIRANVSTANRNRYTKDAILNAASQYFDVEYIGPAKHAKHRYVYQFTKRVDDTATRSYVGRVSNGAGGASKAFSFDHGRRINEIEAALGMRPVPGSLNLRGVQHFDLSANYFRARIGDVIDRKAGLSSPWSTRWCRFYPVRILSKDTDARAFAMRFEGERYDASFLELIAPHSLREVCNIKTGDEVTLWND